MAGNLKAIFRWITGKRPTQAFKTEPYLLATDDFLEQKLHSWGEVLRDEAKENAPWQDRTGEARSKIGYEVVNVNQGGPARALDLEGQSYQENYSVPGSNLWSLVLYHGSAHGRWLEIAMGQKYAIIGPTLEMRSRAIMEDIKASTPGRGP